MSTNQPWRRARGLSLIELILFMVIMGVAAAGIMQVLNMSAKNSADPVRRKQGTLIAESLLEEVESARMTYCDPTDPHVLTADATSVSGAPNATDPTKCAATKEGMGPESGNTRPYDNVNDYQGIGTITTDANGVAFGAENGAAAMTGYSATIAITDGDSLGPSGTSVSSATYAGEMLRITVTVTYSPGETVVLEGYRARYAPNSVP